MPPEKTNDEIEQELIAKIKSLEDELNKVIDATRKQIDMIITIDNREMIIPIDNSEDWRRMWGRITKMTDAIDMYIALIKPNPARKADETAALNEMADSRLESGLEALKQLIPPHQDQNRWFGEKVINPLEKSINELKKLRKQINSQQQQGPISKNITAAFKKLCESFRYIIEAITTGSSKALKHAKDSLDAVTNALNPLNKLGKHVTSFSSGHKVKKVKNDEVSTRKQSTQKIQPSNDS